MIVPHFKHPFARATVTSLILSVCGTFLLRATALRKPSVADPAARKMPWKPVSQQALKPLEAVESDFTSQVPLSPPKSSSEYFAFEGYEERNDEATLKLSIASERSGQAYLCLGRLYKLKGEYAKAVQALAIASDAETGSRFSGELLEAKHAIVVEKALRSRLSKDRKIVRLMPFPVSNQRLWILLSSRETESDGRRADMDLRLTCYRESGGNLVEAWQSEPFESGSFVPRFTRIGIWPVKMTGSETPDLLFMGAYEGGANPPTLIQAFQWKGRKFQKILDEGSWRGPIWIEDIAHSGRFQAKVTGYIGSELSTSQQVEWVDVYDWNGKQYEKANAKFPNCFYEARKQLIEALEEHPNDPQLLRYLARSYYDSEMKSEAYATYRKMEQSCLKHLKEFSDWPDYWESISEYAELSGQISKAIASHWELGTIYRRRLAETTDYDEKKACLQKLHDEEAEIRKLRRKTERHQ